MDLVKGIPVPVRLWSVEAAAWTECGLRDANQDVFATDPERLIFMVADGMGGHAHGKRASEEAVSVAQRVLCGQVHPAEHVEHAILAAHEAVSHHGDNRGTTLTVAVVDGAELVVGHVGDTRLYLNGKQITHDQGVGYALEHFVGGHRIPVVQMHRVALPADAWLLLTTDGVHDTVSVPEFYRDLVRSGATDSRSLARTLTQIALYRGSTDNCTTVAVHLVAAPLAHED